MSMEFYVTMTHLTKLANLELRYCFPDVEGSGIAKGLVINLSAQAQFFNDNKGHTMHVFSTSMPSNLYLQPLLRIVNEN
jgi:hypothetical protein